VLEDGTEVKRRCKNQAVKGMRVCWYHGAAHPNAKRTLRENLAILEFEKMVDALGKPREVDPKQALLDALYAAYGELYAMQLVVQDAVKAGGLGGTQVAEGPGQQEEQHNLDSEAATIGGRNHERQIGTTTTNRAKNRAGPARSQRSSRG
jgi:hypothetical protein